MTINLKLIQDNATLKESCEKLNFENYVIIDTEFSRNKTYFPILSLVQIAAHNSTIVIDILSDLNFSPLLKLLENPKVIKVIHSARQDIEVIHTRFKVIPKNIFDTQIALQFLGFQDLVGYDTLVNHYLGIKINKNLQNSDWLQRPLSQAQLSYAGLDVHYLYDIYPKIYKELVDKGRLEWMQDEIELMTNETSFFPTDEEQLRKFMTHLHDEHSFQVCLYLIRWREKIARDRDILRTRILRNEELAKMASNKKTSHPHLHHKLSADEWNEINEILKRTGVDLKDKELINNLIKLKKGQRITKNETYELLKILLKKISLEEKIAASLIANSEDLLKISAGKTNNLRVFKGWRKEIFGNVVSDFLHGKKGLYYYKGKIIVN